MLEITALRAGYAPAEPVVHDVDLAVGPGETVAVVGESGSGKSTIAKVLLGLLPDGAWAAGSARFAGSELVGRAERAWKGLRGNGIGVVPQGAMGGLNPVRRVEAQLVEVVRLHTAASPAAARTRARELVDLVRLPPDALHAFPHQLSGGMRQRVAIGLALAGDPELLVADEPTTGLDLITQRRILALLAELRADRNLALLVISHDLPGMLTFADRIAVMYGGRIVEHRAAAELCEPDRQPDSHPHTTALLAAAAGHDRDEATPGAVAKPILGVRGVSVAFRARRRAAAALREVSLDLGAGEILGLVGESGSGKSTLARVLLGLLPPSTGTVHVDGVALTSLRGKRLRLARRRIGFVHQDPYGSLHPAMTVHALVGEPLTLAHTPRDDRHERIAGALAAAGLPADAGFRGRLPTTLSGGQRQRVAIARALVADPTLLVADEPTSMLDAATRAGIAATLRRLATEHGLAVLFITHDLTEALRVCDRVAVLHGGEIVETGHPRQLAERPAHDYTALLLGARRFT